MTKYDNGKNKEELIKVEKRQNKKVKEKKRWQQIKKWVSWVILKQPMSFVQKLKVAHSASK